MDTFETERVIYRPLVMDDLYDLYELYRQPTLMRYISYQPRSFRLTKMRLEDHIREHQQYGFGLCAAILKSNGRMIGRCGLQPSPKKRGRMDANIAWLFEEAYWNQGLATEFARAMIQIGFEQLRITRIYARADQRNQPSIRVMEKAGMRFYHETLGEVLYECWNEKGVIPFQPIGS